MGEQRSSVHCTRLDTCHISVFTKVDKTFPLMKGLRPDAMGRSRLRYHWEMISIYFLFFWKETHGPNLSKAFHACGDQALISRVLFILSCLVRFTSLFLTWPLQLASEYISPKCNGIFECIEIIFLMAWKLGNTHWVCLTCCHAFNCHGSVCLVS